MLTTLLSNVARLTKTNKESYFGRRWGAVAGLQKQIDKKEYQFDELLECSPHATLSKTIINRYENPVVPTELVPFVTRMRDASVTFLARQRCMQRAHVERLAAYNQSGANVVTTMFTLLNTCALELNNSLGFSELNIVSTPPQHVGEAVTFTKSRQPQKEVTFFRTRFASPTWSLVIRSRHERIECFLLPTTRVMGLSIVENGYEPVAVITAHTDDDGIEWSLDQKPLTGERLSELCMVLFKRLLDETKSALD
jgi:hypothetical protein